MRIGSREIGPGHPTYIVAELGANHGGSLHLAVHQMSLAKQSGADAVKFQTRTLPNAIPEDQRDVMKDTPWGRITYADYRKHLELHETYYYGLFLEAKALNIDLFTSVWDVPSVDFVEKFDPIAYKIPSPCLTDDALLRAVAATGRPVILSTGMSVPREIDEALRMLKGRDNIICQCTSSYPLDPSEVNLRFIGQLGILRPDDHIGYSGHELGTAISIAAVALGACYIERHFTDDKTQWGSDQAMSLEPDEFASMVRGIREVEQALGDGIKVVYDSERSAMKKLRRTHGRPQKAEAQVGARL